jgi:hypothetical protein
MRTRLRVFRTIAEPVQVKETASVTLPQSAPATWSFMWNPASSVKLFETTEMGVTLPGSPQGVGEIQVFVERTENGKVASLHEVVELDPGRRAVTRSLVPGYPYRSVLTIEPLGPDACLLTQEFRADLPAGLPVWTVREVRDGFKDVLRTMMDRLTELAAQPWT